MKIEIELEEVESLREKVENQSFKIMHLEEELRNLNKEVLTDKAIKLSYYLFENYVRCIFQKLGFNGTPIHPIYMKNNMERLLGKTWYEESDKIEVELGVEILNDFKKAFLNIGVIPQAKMEEKGWSLDDEKLS